MKSYSTCLFTCSDDVDMKTAQDVISEFSVYADDRQSLNLMRFFKTGKGEYGEGDKFLGLKVPQVRGVVKAAKGLVAMCEIEKLLYSEWHDARLAGLLLLVEEMKGALPKRSESHTARAEERTEIVKFYLRHAQRANNWDLVDLSCQYILGVYLLYPEADGKMPDRGVLDRLADSDNLWEQRISIVSTLALIRAGQFDDALRVSMKLLGHTHDLIHKAVGWVLREVGKKNVDLLVDFLESHHSEMSRTTLRYSIEKFSEKERRYWMSR